jgi:transcriptional regulator with XRE-family HTH domain
MDQLGWSISELAKKAKVSRPYLSRVLSGQQQPSLDRAEKIGKPLGLKVKTVKA